MSPCQSGKLHKYVPIVKVPCINVYMHMRVHERLRWHVYCARSAGVHSGEARVGGSSAQMLTEHIMRFKRPVFDPRDKKWFFWNHNVNYTFTAYYDIQVMKARLVSLTCQCNMLRREEYRYRLSLILNNYNYHDHFKVKFTDNFTHELGEWPMQSTAVQFRLL